MTVYQVLSVQHSGACFLEGLQRMFNREEWLEHDFLPNADSSCWKMFDLDPHPGPCGCYKIPDLADLTICWFNSIHQSPGACADHPKRDQCNKDMECSPSVAPVTGGKWNSRVPKNMQILPFTLQSPADTEGAWLRHAMETGQDASEEIVYPGCSKLCVLVRLDLQPTLRQQRVRSCTELARWNGRTSCAKGKLSPWLP